MNNVQKMQKALDKIIVITTEWQGSIPFGEVRKIAKVARKLPLRNCDVGSAEEQEERFKNFCLSYYEPCNVDGECWKCPLFKTKTRCPIAWAQLPYEPDTKKEERNDAE